MHQPGDLGCGQVLEFLSVHVALVHVAIDSG
jgi:hypothetical protein